MLRARLSKWFQKTKFGIYTKTQLPNIDIDVQLLSKGGEIKITHFCWSLRQNEAIFTSPWVGCFFILYFLKVLIHFRYITISQQIIWLMNFIHPSEWVVTDKCPLPYKALKLPASGTENSACFTTCFHIRNRLTEVSWTFIIDYKSNLWLLRWIWTVFALPKLWKYWIMICQWYMICAWIILTGPRENGRFIIFRNYFWLYSNEQSGVNPS